MKEIQVCPYEELFDSLEVDNGVFPLFINIMIKLYVFINLNCFRRWAMLPMGLLFLNLLHYKQKFVSIKMEQNFQTKYWHLTKNKHMRRKF